MSWNKNYIRKINKILKQCHIKNQKNKNKLKYGVIKNLNN